jgi:hypothetical protein
MTRKFLYILIGQLQILLIYLKLTKIINHNWFIVLTPLLILPTLILLAVMLSVSVYIYKKYIRKNASKTNNTN